MNAENNTAGADQAPADEQQFHPFRLLAVIAGVTGSLAVLCYILQVYYLGTG